MVCLPGYRRGKGSTQQWFQTFLYGAWWVSLFGSAHSGEGDSAGLCWTGTFSHRSVEKATPGTGRVSKAGRAGVLEEEPVWWKSPWWVRRQKKMEGNCRTIKRRGGSSVQPSTPLQEVRKVSPTGEWKTAVGLACYAWRWPRRPLEASPF